MSIAATSLSTIAGAGLPHYCAMGALVLAGACLQGVGGLGFTMFCAPLALLLFPELVPGPLLVLGCPLAALAAVREFRAIEWHTAGYALAGRACGAVLATAVLRVLPANLLSILFALLILTGVALSARGWKVPSSAVASTGAGVASGLMGTITTAGGPPLAIAFHHLPPAPMRATLGCVFFAGSIFSLAALATVGHAGPHDLVVSLLLLPWMAAGFFLSGPLARRMSRAQVRALLLGLAAFGAVAVLVQTAIHHFA